MKQLKGGNGPPNLQDGDFVLSSSPPGELNTQLTNQPYMKNKYKTNRTGIFPGLLAFLFLLFTGWGNLAMAQGDVNIGTASGNTNGTAADPICDYFNSMKYQVVYTAAEIAAAGGGPGNIERLAWTVTQDNGPALLNYEIVMAHYTGTTLAGTTMLTNVSAGISNWTVVRAAASYDAVLGTNYITFGTPFNWDGTSNLFIQVCTPGSNPYASPYGGVSTYTSAANSVFFRRVDAANACPQTIRSGVSGAKPVVRLFMQTAGCLAPSGLNAVVAGSNATLSWGAVGGAAGYEVYWGASPLAAPTALTPPTISPIAGTSTGLAGLAQLTTYIFYVRTDCGGGVFSTWAGPFTFATGCLGTSCNYVFNMSDSFGDGWNGASITVRQNGTVTNIVTLPTGSNGTTNVSICNTSPFTLTWTAGAWDGECSFALFSPFGAPLYNFATGASPANNAVFYSNIGDCTAPSCSTPTAPSATWASAGNALVSWTAAAPVPALGYDLFISPNALPAPGPATVPTVNNNAPTTYNLSIAAGVTRYIWVRSDCGGTQSSWVGPIAYTQGPDNNRCSSATPITCGSSTNGTNVGADAVGAGPFCGTTPGPNGVWYTWTGNGDDVLFSTCNAGSAGLDTKINVYSGTCGALTCVAGNDDGACGFSGLLSTVGFTSTNATQYFIYVTGFNAFEQGPFTLDMTCIPPLPPPANNDCATPTVIAQLPICSPTAGTTLGATASGIATPSCAFFAGDDDVFYEFTATSATVNVQVQGLASFDAVVQVLNGCGGAQLACADNTFNGGQENVTLTGLTVGNQYIVRVFSYATGGANQGNFTICVFNGVDPCATVTPITCGSVQSYNESGGGIWSVTSCWFGGTPGREKLFSFTPTVSGIYQINVTSATGGFVDYFFKPVASGCNQTGWNCILDIGGGGFYEFGPLVAGTPYYLLLDGEGTGAYNHTFRLLCPPANDNCSVSAPILSWGGVAISGTTQAANPSVVQTSLEPAADYPDVWYRFQPIGTTAQVTLNTSSLLAAGLEIYANCGDATPICVEYAQNQGEDLLLTATGLTSGATYYVRVIDLLSGTLGLNFSTYFFTIEVDPVPPSGANCVTPPPFANDESEACGASTNNGCAQADNANMPTTGTVTVTTQLAQFYDSGGAVGAYQANETGVITFAPTNPANKIRVTFTQFDVEASWDGLFIYNGPTTGSPIVPSGNPAGSGCPTANAWWGTSNPAAFTSTSATGELTFRFCSDGSVQNAGWVALIEETNGGVPVAANAFGAYSIGDFVEGTVFAECGTRDLDWFEFSVAQVSPVSFNVTAEFPVTAFILNNNCPSTAVAVNSTTADCQQAQATTVLLPGTYRLAVAPNSFNGIPCTSTRNEYFFQLVLASPPPNDDCVDAQIITCGLPGTCPSNQVVGNTLAALEEAIPDPVCNPGGNISDVWYAFTVGFGATEIEVNLDLQSATQLGVELYSTCGAFIAGTCIDDASAASPFNFPVVSGNSYRLRVYTNYDTDNPGTFRLCVQNKPQPPVNDDICGAIVLPIFSANPTETVGNNFYATNSPQPSMSCGTHSRDMWYRATVPASGVVTVNTNYGTADDLLAAIYTSSDNTCTGVLTQVGCNDDNGPLNAAWLQANNLTPGATVFIRVAGFGAFPASTNKGTFRIAVTEGLVWTGASDAFYNTISDPDLGIPTNWYNYDGGFYGPGNLNDANISICIPTAIPTQPQVSGTIAVRTIRAFGNTFNFGGITTQAGAQLNIHGNINSNTLTTPRFTGPGTFRFNSAAATTHTIANNARFFSTVTIAPTSTVNGNGRMIMENNSSLFADSPAATFGNVTGNIIYRRTGSLDQYAYNYWSSPVSSATISSISAPGFVPNTYQYETSIATGLDYDGTQAGWLAVGGATVMTPGRGYIATGAGTASFTGNPNQGTVTYTASAGGGGNTWNLVGNPYPAQVNAFTFLSQNTGRIVGGSIYIWDDDATGGIDYTVGDYIVSNGTITVSGPNSGDPFSGSIGSCQGFFINWNSAGPAAINWNTSARLLTGTNAEFFDVQDYARVKLRISNSQEMSSETALIFPADATDGADLAYDAVRLPGNPSLGIYTFINSDEYVIQALPTLSTERIIPLGVINTVAGEASIEINQFEYFEPGVFVYLEDMEEGIFHNLTSSAYTYTNTSINTQDPIRFRLHLRAPLAVTATAACAGQASGKMLMSNPNSTPVVVEVKDNANNVVTTTTPFTGEKLIENLAAGAYIINFSYSNGDAATLAKEIGTGSIFSAPNFIASATTVAIEDAIIEFQATAPGATEFEWNFGDGTMVSNDLNPVHAYMQPGVYTVTFTARNGGCESVQTMTVTVNAASTGIANVNTNGFTLYPNPARNLVNILLNVDRSESQVKVSILDAAGRLVRSENVNDVRSGSIIELNISDLASGVYQIALEGDNFREVSRLTVSR